MAISKIAVKRPISTTMFFIAILVLGFVSLKKLSVDLLPDLKYPQLLIRTIYPDASPEEIMHFITIPLEEGLSGISGLKKMESFSKEGVSFIKLIFYWGTDMEYAALNVRERLDEIQAYLPKGAQRSHVLRLDPSAKPIITLALSGIEAGRLTNIAKDLIRRRLEEIDGVAMVEVFGGIKRRIMIKINPEKLNTLNIDISQIESLLKYNNLSKSGGTIRKGKYRYAIYIDAEIHNIDEIKNMAIVTRANSNIIFLKDIAQIDYEPEERKTITLYNSNPTIGINITKEAGTNTIEVTKKVKKALYEVKQQLKDLQINIVNEQADFIENSINNVFSNLIWGALLAFLSIFIFLHKIRDPLNISISIPISIIATFLIMYITKVNLNMMSLGGLALGVGMLVDNSIVVLENIFRLKEEGANLIEASIKGAQEVAMPVLASTLTSCAVFLPIIYVKGIAGQLFRDYSLTIVFSLLTSVLVSLTMLPVLISKYKGRPLSFSEAIFYDLNEKNNKIKFLKYIFTYLLSFFSKIKKSIKNSYKYITTPIFNIFDKYINKIYNKYHTIVIYALNNKLKTCGIFILIIIITGILSFFIDRRFFPSINQNQIKYHIELPNNATIYQTEEVCLAIENILKNTTGVKSYFTRIGPLMSIFNTNQNIQRENQAVITINLQKGIETYNFIQKFKKKLPKNFYYKGYFDVGNLQFNDIIGISGKDLELYIQGPATDILLDFAKEVKKNLKSINGLEDIIIDYEKGITQYKISINRDITTYYNISAHDISLTIKRLISGNTVTKIKELNRMIDIMVRADDNFRTNWFNIYNYKIKTIYGYVPLSKFITYEIVTTPKSIQRVWQIPTIKIFATIKGRDRKQVIKDINKLLEKLNNNDNIKVRLSGQQEEIEKSFFSLKLAFLLSLILIYLILAAQFESLKYPFIVLFSVPYGLIGVIFILFLTSNSLNVITGIGIIILIGIVINDDIVKIDFINQERRKGKNVREAILSASKKRFRPIVITTITTVFGLLPMAFSTGQGQELQRGLAITIIGGMITGTILTLIMVPVFYELFSKKIKIRRINEKS